MPSSSDEELPLSTLFPDIAEFFSESSECNVMLDAPEMLFSKRERSSDSTESGVAASITEQSFKKSRSQHMTVEPEKQKKAAISRLQCTKKPEELILQREVAHLRKELEYSQREADRAHREAEILRTVINQLIRERDTLLQRVAAQEKCLSKGVSEKPNSLVGDMTLFPCATRRPIAPKPVASKQRDDANDFINILT